MQTLSTSFNQVAVAQLESLILWLIWYWVLVIEHDAERRKEDKRLREREARRIPPRPRRPCLAPA